VGKESKWFNNFETLLLSATVILSGLVSLLDFLGVLDSIPWLAKRIPVLTLLVIGLVAGYLILERKGQLEKMHNNLNSRMNVLEQSVHHSATTIIASLKGVELTPFESGIDLLRYVNRRLQSVQSQVDDLSWSPIVGLGRELSSTRKANQEYADRIAKISNKISYREVMIFNRPDRIEKLKQRIAKNSPGYSCSYYETSNVPLLQFMIIDRTEVIVLSDQFQTQFALKHPHIVKLFIEYYEEVWKHAIPIKIGKEIKSEIVDNIISKSSH